ncbi:MAG TPA: type III-A CRISPR-associated protein Cas10/Csm1 [Bacteroidales bacterium]|nr:type III-A CRISPR-associated protein Cas10/Csm1 [Bacteroidales bacterium]HOK98998.1 type III-A CRISPR-associated protein Cas10/Csm1 [Bacteroidales bacterium]HPO65442.1 type III-A CRISPR-associated protein Cas10/Csm1 [Bacteroidales bacterium]
MATRDEIYLAALLHDIGKFYERADKSDVINSKIIKEQIKNIKNLSNLSHITQDGFVTHSHAAYTQQFFEEQAGFINSFFENQDKDNNVTNLAIYHHKPKTELQKIIQLADWWSSGIDRNKDYQKSSSSSYYKNRPLISIFKELNIDTNNTQNLTHININLNKLSLNKDSIFPIDNHNVSTNSYESLWQEFENEFEQIRHSNFRNFVDTIYFLLQKYLWCIPATTRKEDIHDSNLFEHSKTTAAIALCLYDYLEEKKIKSIDHLTANHRPLQLVCIDISGIQSFIYNISMKGAAKALKGRSFYLQLLMDTLINELLYDLNYYRSNILYSSGGKAYLLLPNTQKVNDYINEYQGKIEKWLFEKFNGSLYVSLGKVTFYFDRNRNEGEPQYLINDQKEHCLIGELWKKALDDATTRKNQRFKSIINTDNQFFEPFGSGGIHEVCDLTGEEITDKEKYTIDDYIFSLPVGEQIELGKILKDTEYFVWKKENDKLIEKNCLLRLKNKASALNILNSYWYFFNQNQKPSSVDNGVIYKAVLDNFDFLNTISGNSVQGFKFYAGTTEIREFGDLLNKDSEFKRLAAFVMDVDNLGKIFVNGFKYKKETEGDLKVKDKSSFSRLTTLSFYLDLFFSGYVNKLKQKYEKELLIIYSGGDDLLAIGEWNAVLEFAKDIRDEFYRFVCQRPEISFSGGISLFPEKYPVSKAIANAKEAEEKAKKFKNERKGALGLFDEVLSWRMDDNELDKVHKIKDNLVQFYENEIITSSFIQRFQLLYEVKKIGHEKNDLSYRWNAAYYFKRYEKRVAKKATQEFNEFMKNLYEDLALFLSKAQIDFFISERNYELYAIAARWAELEIRTEKVEANA